MGKKQAPYLMLQKHGEGFSAIEEELDYLDAHLKPIYTTNPSLLVVSPVNFVGDFQYRETRLLKKQYELLHKELTVLALRDDWFQVILERLASE